MRFPILRGKQIVKATHFSSQPYFASTNELYMKIWYEYLTKHHLIFSYLLLPCIPVTMHQQTVQWPT